MHTDLLNKTLKTMAVMVGACVAFTGLVTVVALFVVGRAVGPRESGPELVPASQIEGQAPATPPRTGDAPPRSNANKADLPPRATRAI